MDELIEYLNSQRMDHQNQAYSNDPIVKKHLDWLEKCEDFLKSLPKDEINKWR
jgi:hypothetical protein